MKNISENYYKWLAQLIKTIGYGFMIVGVVIAFVELNSLGKEWNDMFSTNLNVQYFNDKLISIFFPMLGVFLGWLMVKKASSNDE